MRAALKNAAPGSPAHAYLSHQANVAESQLDGGLTTSAVWASAVGGLAVEVSIVDAAEDWVAVATGGAVGTVCEGGCPFVQLITRVAEAVMP